MINTFITRCARNTHIYCKAWNQELNHNLHSVKNVRLLNNTPKSSYRLLILDRVLTNKFKHSNKILSNNYSTFKGKSEFSWTPETKRRSDIRNDAFNSFGRYLEDQNDFIMTYSEWEKLCQDIVEEDPSIERILDSSIMTLLKNKPDLCLSFLRYIKSKKEPNLATWSHFFRICGTKYEDIVVEELEKCKETLGSSKLVVEKIAPAIVKTREWRQVKDWIIADLVSIHTSPLVLKMSLKEQDYTAFYQMWTKMRDQVDKMFSNVSTAFFESWENGWIPTDLFLELLKLEDLPLFENEMQKLNIYCKSKWASCKSTELVKVDLQSRRCTSCAAILPEVEPINESIIKKMYSDTVKKALIKTNIFAQTNPAEVQKFVQFMQRHGKFDYVIDGLNFAHDRNGHSVLEILTNLKRQGKRVLVITKGSLFKKFGYKGPVFTVGHQTYDDLYVLLSALQSGPKCYVITNDDFGDHFEMMSPELKPRFLSWRAQQRVFHHGNKNVGVKYLLHPATYKFRVSETEEHWHVPCQPQIINTDMPNCSYSYKCLEMKLRKFLCVKKAYDYVPSPELILFRKIIEEWQK